MQLQTSVIFSQVAQYCVLLAVGFLGIRLGALSEQGLSALSSYVMKMAIPAMILTRLPSAATREVLAGAWRFLLVGVGTYALLFAVAWLTARLCRLPPDTARVHLVQFGLGNLGMMGIVLILATLGDAAGIYVAVLFLIDQCLLWVVGTTLSYPAGSGRGFDVRILKKLFNPMVASLLAALAMILLDMRFQGVLGDALSSLGDSAKPVSMVFIGGMTGAQRIGRVANLRGVAAIVLVKMLAMPAAIFWLTGMLPFLDMTARLTLLLATALPSLFMMSILARANGSDYEYATLTVFVTTLCSMITIPLAAGLANRIS